MRATSRNESPTLRSLRITLLIVFAGVLHPKALMPGMIMDQRRAAVCTRDTYDAYASQRKSAANNTTCIVVIMPGIRQGPDHVLGSQEYGKRVGNACQKLIQNQR
ncbi:hypothetical protein BC835DRAFT_1338431 [Cytidiella melzeri]|nr:hypothetical protein BC835DRAFT_1338431 [Cytidiella melzeri]